MQGNRTRFLRVFAIAGLCTALMGCSQATMPATVYKLHLLPSASITSSSLGLDGRVWFAFLGEGPGPGVGYMDLNGDIQMTQLDSITFGHAIGDLAVDAKHGVWATLPCYPSGSRCDSGFARFGGDYGPLTNIHSLGGGDTLPLGVTLTGDGSAWIAERNANAIVHVTADDKQTVVKLSDPAFKPVGAQAADDGGAYFDGPEPGKIIAVDRRGRLRSYMLPARSSHTSSAIQDRDGNIWVTEYDADKIVSIDRLGRMTEYDVPTPNGGPWTITVDRHGVKWFIEFDGEKLGRIDSNGRIEDSYLPLDVGRPEFLAAGPNDTLVVIGFNKSLFGSSRSWAIARIPEATAMP